MVCYSTGVYYSIEVFFSWAAFLVKYADFGVAAVFGVETDRYDFKLGCAGRFV